MSAEYGAYLALSAGCPGCHGPGLSGGKIPQAPPNTVAATNITPAGLGAWSETDFLRVMRNGTWPDGRRLDAFMPWPYFAQMTDDDWMFPEARYLSYVLAHPDENGAPLFIVLNAAEHGIGLIMPAWRDCSRWLCALATTPIRNQPTGNQYRPGAHCEAPARSVLVFEGAK